MAFPLGKTPCSATVCRRGPDLTSDVVAHGFQFVHYLLHVTGEPTPQPFVDGGVFCLYNGEIYDRPFARSDGEVILPLYRRYGPLFARHLDGEFAIALYDFEKRCAVFCTDAFGTKPLWVNGNSAASYRSCLGGEEVPPNTILVRTFEGEVSMHTVRKFDFDHQHKTTFADWDAAFERAVSKRAHPACFIGLSSGYDSGAIACVLAARGLEFSAFGVLGSEDEGLLRARLERHGGRLLTCSADEHAALQSRLKEFAEEYEYASVRGGPVHCRYMTDDWGAIGSAVLYEAATSLGLRVCLSGQGADEILSDYALYPDVSTLHGVFPERLLPWPNFFGGCQRAYLRKEEYVAGSYGVEARYPFLDTAVVQEFLWLDRDLKNQAYKAPLDHLLRRSGYPFNANRKVGFSAI